MPPRNTTDFLIIQAQAFQNIESGIPGAPPIGSGLLAAARGLPPGLPLPGAAGIPVLTALGGGAAGPVASFQSLLATLAPPVPIQTLNNGGGFRPGPLNGSNVYARQGLG